MLLAPWKAENPVTAHCTMLNASVLSFWPWRPGRLLDSQLLFFCPSQKSADNGRSGWCFHQQEALQEGKWHFQCWLPVGSVTYAGVGLSQFILPGAAYTNIPTGWSVLGSSWQTRLDDHHRRFLPRTEQWWITGMEHQAWQENRQSVFRTYLRMCWNEYL